MTAYILHRKGQSIYDLCLQSYGTLDLLIKFCVDNSVTDMAFIPQQVNYQYDTTLVKYEGNINIYNTVFVVNRRHYKNQSGIRYAAPSGAEYLSNN